MSEAPITREQFVTFLNAVNGDLTPGTAGISSNTNISYKGNVIFAAGNGINREAGTWVAQGESTTALTHVSWYGAVAYAEWLQDNLQLFLPETPTAFGLSKVSLPTEAQWEYACRAGTTTAYYWGAAFDGAYAWCSGNSSGVAKPIKAKSVNPWGLYDMSGNIYEWCSDIFSNSDTTPMSYNTYAASAAGQTDPVGVASNGQGATRHSLRGGNYSSAESAVRSAHRSYDPADAPAAVNGFRVVIIPN
jgi:formylglycine-generating enzyme required for sulfatase activity